MDRQPATALVAAAGPPRKARPLKAFWRRVRKPLAESPRVKNAVASLLVRFLRFVYRTNRPAEGSEDPEAVAKAHAPSIITLWHGQHLLAPCTIPHGHPVVAMFSKSADAELNALVAEKLGFEIVRGSGGRNRGRATKKGGARALLALKKALQAGKTVAMIADIPHGAPRQAGLGIVTLAKISGRPIIPAALVTSRRKVLERSWDRTTVNLPFGRRAIATGEPIYVRPDADEAEMERKRREVTDGLNAAMARAYRLVDARK